MKISVTRLIIALSFGLASAEANAQMVLRKLDDPFERWYLTEEPVPEDFEENPLNYHPNFDFKHADALFEAGRKEEAVYWMYQGQLRYRIMIDCLKLGILTPDYDTYTALSQTVQADQNAWLGGDIQLWVDTLAAVSDAYDPANDVMIKDKSCEVSASGVLNGLEEIRDYILMNYHTMRDQREAGGMENRTTGDVVDKRAPN